MLQEVASTQETAFGAARAADIGRRRDKVNINMKGGGALFESPGYEMTKI